MPVTFFGFGTTYIGERDFGTDRSFVTTEFIAAALLPLCPIRSVRVVEGKYIAEHSIFWRSDYREYLILAQGKINIRQAACVYSYTALHITYFIALAYVRPKWMLEEFAFVNPNWILQSAMFVLPAIIPIALRRKAKRHATAHISTLCPCGSGSEFKACCFAKWAALNERERNKHKTFIGLE